MGATVKVEQVTTTVKLTTAAPKAPWSPMEIAGLTVWLDASQETAISGQWTDRSGSGKHGTVVGSPAPVLMQDASLKGKFVRFTANQGRIRNSSSGITTDYTLVYLTRRWGPNVGRCFTAIYPPPNFLVGYHTSGYDCAYDNGWVKAGGGWPPAPTPWRMYGMDGRSSGGYMARFFINGVQDGVATIGAGMMGTYALSGYDAVGAQETIDADVAEMVIYNRRLLGTERQQVEDYLRKKWGL